MRRRQFLRTSIGVSLAGFWAAGRSRAGEAAPTPASAVIERARQAAMELLKPTPKELQHGLELHAASVVCDAYGFSPRANTDPEALARAIEAGASSIELEDLREEMGMTRCVSDAGQRAEYLQAWDASGVTCIFQNAGEESQAPLRVLKRLARYTYVTDMLRDRVGRAVSADDIVAAKKREQHCLYMSANGVPLTQQWESIEGELAYVRVFYQMGVRMMHMTYNRRNMLGDGCAELANAGLSDFGRAAVAEMNRVGVIPDVAHSGWQTSLETAKASQKPVVASHTGCDAVNHHIRCKPDNVIRAIAETGGYVGICCIPSFLGSGGDLAAMLGHIDHVVRRFGIDHVAIGTDAGYAAAAAPAGPAAKRVKAGPSRPRWERFWPADAFKLPSGHPSLAWTNWPLFTVGLVQRGYSDGQIEKILSGNMLRVARQSMA